MENATPQATAQPEAGGTVTTATLADTGITAEKLAGGKSVNKTADVPQTITVKYNHEEKTIPIDEAVRLAQKGMNYDKVYGELDALKNDPARKEIDSIAAMLGVTPAEALKQWRALIRDGKAQKYAEEHDVPVEVAKDVVGKDDELTLTKSELQQYKTKDEIDREIAEFFAAYPDLKDTDIPDEVLQDRLTNGVPLIKAYAAYQAKALREENAELKKQLGVKRVNDQNSASSMGSAASSGNTQQVEITEESIKKMTPEEKAKNHARIWEFLTGKRKE